MNLIKYPELNRIALLHPSPQILLGDDISDPLSNCHLAPAFVDGDDKEGTHYYVCSKCGNPCDIHRVDERKMNEPIIDAIVTIGNHERVIKDCEPNVMQPMELKNWMVVRTIKALELFEDEWKRISEDT